ncbi:MAG: TonB-dependent receptor, partial [Sphingobacterium sp.]
RVIDQDTKWQANQDMGGLSANLDIQLGKGTITSTSAWRFWNWDPSNDRDFTGLQGLAKSQAPSRQDQWSQEIRWAGQLSPNLHAVAGVFAFGQKLNADPAHTEEAGVDQWRFSKNSDSKLWETPGLLEGYGIKSYPSLKTFSGAFFTQVDWEVLPGLNILPGFRLNYDDKSVAFRRETYGGLQTDDAELLALKNSVYSDQSFESSTDKMDISGQLTVSYKPTPRINTFATFSTGFKPVGLNLGGLPNSEGQPMLALAVIKPERVRHYELGVKSQPLKDVLLNLTLFNTDVEDYQAQVQAADLSVNRGYLANAEKVRVRGAEIDARALLHKNVSAYGSLAYTEGKYISFKNAPVPLEETGSQNFKDISGGRLPGISRWATSFGVELTSNYVSFIGQRGKLFLALDGYFRSEFSSSPSPSAYLNVAGYTLLNARVGFRGQQGTSFFIWSRNLANIDYFEQLLPGAGSAGHYAAVLGDPRTLGVTLKFEIQ